MEIFITIIIGIAMGVFVKMAYDEVFTTRKELKEHDESIARTAKHFEEYKKTMNNIIDERNQTINELFDTLKQIGNLIDNYPDCYLRNSISSIVHRLYQQIVKNYKENKK